MSKTLVFMNALILIIAACTVQNNEFAKASFALLGVVDIAYLIAQLIKEDEAN